MNENYRQCACAKLFRVTCNEWGIMECGAHFHVPFGQRELLLLSIPRHAMLSSLYVAAAVPE